MENLQATVQWTGWEFLPGAILVVCGVFAFIYFKKQQHKKATWFLLGGTVIFVQLGLFFFINGVFILSS